MPYGERKKGPVGRDKAKHKSDCIQCLSVRSVTLKIETKRVEVEMGKFEMGKFEMQKEARGRCDQCGFYTSISVMEEALYNQMKHLLESEPAAECSQDSTVQYETSPDGPSEDLKEALSEGDTSLKTSG